MTKSTMHDGTENHSPNPILVAFFEKVRYLAEEVARRERAIALQSEAIGIQIEKLVCSVLQASDTQLKRPDKNVVDLFMQHLSAELYALPQQTQAN